ncbi:uncharacterized protein C8Q71DRAFT_309305 [Rhodofomes roseus]|uniref:Uncharacterized protein n=1 Tax=Rhodofomes roseus TaxID=34475 RepID=A0ABQ8K3J2_9APHY|nr:uncharacterized protein C8Q71DRAFT_309305 [Rhodofomes roseus]KAH9831197.1 hypothetical protein C8Q71DRAFT_309305 [Rhodofomes roseus]
MASSADAVALAPELSSLPIHAICLPGAVVCLAIGSFNTGAGGSVTKCDREEPRTSISISMMPRSCFLHTFLIWMCSDTRRLPPRRAYRVHRHHARRRTATCANSASEIPQNPPGGLVGDDMRRLGDKYERNDQERWEDNLGAYLCPVGSLYASVNIVCSGAPKR